MNPQVMLRTHVQAGGKIIASVEMPDGRMLRIAGEGPEKTYVRIFGIERAQAKQRELVVGLLKDWVTWERRNRP